jgi:hypothetical protein
MGNRTTDDGEQPLARCSGRPPLSGADVPSAGSEGRTPTKQRLGRLELLLAAASIVSAALGFELGCKVLDFIGILGACVSFGLLIGQALEAPPSREDAR